MCRIVAYMGTELLLEDVLVKPVNSMVMQSLHARESEIPTNGDGFGIGWYTPDISHEPAVFKSIAPAWNDQNLLHLTAKIKSPVFFSHVRAASAGGVTQYNCHPFVHQQWMLMHNGGIQDFISVKRHIRHLLEDDVYHWLQGETDSEHIFALFMQLAKGKDLKQLDVVADVLEQTLKKINALTKAYGQSGTSYFNICLTDGKRMIACRYCSDPKEEPSTLHYSVGHEFVAREGHYHMLKGETNRCSLIASEKLTNFNGDWQDVQPGHALLIDENLQVVQRPMAI